MKYRLHLSYLLIAIFCLLLGGCSGSSSASRKEHSGPPRDSTPRVLTPSADGVTVYQNDFASIDTSNTSQGYVMVKYNGTNEKVKLQITCPDQSCYTYLISDRGAYDTFPLTAGNGSYAYRFWKMSQVTLIPSHLPNPSTSASKMNSFLSCIRINM